MHIERFTGSYNAVISLGSNCLPAIQLERNGLRRFTGPIDWMDSKHTSAITELIRSRFNHFLYKPHLQSIGILNDFVLIQDNHYQVIVVHDFPVTNNNEQIWNSYPEVIDKVTRRIQRLYQYMERSDRLLFIRTDTTMNDALLLEQELRNQVKNEFHLLIVNHEYVGTLSALQWPLVYGTAFAIPKDNDIWNDNDAHWRTLLQGVKIAPTRKFTS
ncbi:DUF1796 family putative cysteine peptidase [Paenibacillus agilis]|uniref:Peptidase n=1 Tax=Paenibacillus agilis TaxID=3020863 RepID=A0A559IWY6_9BACL|nr:DUF1796 family putative cysteine peptidase [Paenibacillus agilis]TVX92106.1 hypothetical protein FPZ44_02960 [Paenibacillus agilis]